MEEDIQTSPSPLPDLMGCNGRQRREWKSFGSRYSIERLLPVNCSLASSSGEEGWKSLDSNLQPHKAQKVTRSTSPLPRFIKAVSNYWVRKDLLEQIPSYVGSSRDALFRSCHCAEWTFQQCSCFWISPASGIVGVTSSLGCYGVLYI